MFEKITELIKRYNTVIIHRHKNPDGDALGSQIGFAECIRSAYPEKQVYTVGDAPGRFSFMEGSTPDVIADSVYKDALAIVLDTSAAALIADERYKTAAASARIDHHIFVERICDEEVTDTSYESCCGLITELAIEVGWELTPLAAKSLYCGMVTDSGRFRYDSTSSNTHRLASHLLSTKFDTNDIYRNLYADDLAFVKLRASFVLKIRIAAPGVAYIYTDAAELAATGCDTFTVSRGMVNVMGDIKGIDIWVNFTEAEEGVLAELRSSRYNINPVAVAHGGGGHAKASGARLKDKKEADAMLAELISLAQKESV